MFDGCYGSNCLMSSISTVFDVMCRVSQNSNIGQNIGKKTQIRYEISNHKHFICWL